MLRLLNFLLLFLALAACNTTSTTPDASGTFEADEVIVSSELSGKIIRLDLEEGAQLGKDSVVGRIDALPVQLQKEQVEASIESLQQKTLDPGPQISMLQQQAAVQQTRLDYLLSEKNRMEALVKADAATRKQLDDLNAQILVAGRELEVTSRQIAAQKNSINTQNRGILSESAPLRKRIAQLDDQLERSKLVNPIAGTVLSKYAEAGEITAAGKALYKIADLRQLTLRAYITATQLAQVKLNQAVEVRVDDGPGKYRTLPGTVSWIADKAEFTPKTIQTKEERANLVYAIKVRVVNDGLLKIGMYGELILPAPPAK